MVVITPYPTNPQWPTNFQGCQLTGQFIGLTGAPRAGKTITLTPSPAVLIDTANNLLIVGASDPLTITLDTTGTVPASTLVPATDDPDITPTGWTYAVVENWQGGRSYNMVAPQNTTVSLVTAGGASPAANAGTFPVTNYETGSWS